MSSFDFYKTTPKIKVPKSLTPGLIVHAPFLFLDNPCPLFLRYDVEKNPELLEPPPLTAQDYLPEFSVNLRKFPADAFDEKNPVLKKLGLNKKEEFLVYKAKKRPGIIISGYNFNQQSSTVMVVPMFTLEKDYIPDEDKEAIRSGTHPYYFYLPESTSHNVQESFVDFKQIQTIAQQRITTKRVSLTEPAIQALYMKQIMDATDAYTYVTNDYSAEGEKTS